MSDQSKTGETRHHDGLSTSQHDHMDMISAWFDTAMRDKYRRGVQEHGGNLNEFSALRLLNEAIDETIDQVVYLTTARERLIQDSQSRTDLMNVGHGNMRWFLIAVCQELEQSKVKFGSLPDRFHALALLFEEVGEVSEAVLRLTRAERGEEDVEEPLKDIRTELIQVVSLSYQMWVRYGEAIERLEKERQNAREA